MPTARIFQRPKSSMSSGKYRTDLWQLEFEPAKPQNADPLTGWAGSGDIRDQVRLRFPTKEAAIAHAERNGWDYELVPAPPRRLLLQSYADNFR